MSLFEDIPDSLFCNKCNLCKDKNKFLNKKKDAYFKSCLDCRTETKKKREEHINKELLYKLECEKECTLEIV